MMNIQYKIEIFFLYFIESINYNKNGLFIRRRKQKIDKPISRAY
jgi:hypothetical protein